MEVAALRGAQLTSVEEPLGTVLPRLMRGRGLTYRALAARTCELDPAGSGGEHGPPRQTSSRAAVRPSIPAFELIARALDVPPDAFGSTRSLGFDATSTRAAPASTPRGGVTASSSADRSSVAATAALRVSPWGQIATIDTRCYHYLTRRGGLSKSRAMVLGDAIEIVEGEPMPGSTGRSTGCPPSSPRNSPPSSPS